MSTDINNLTIVGRLVRDPESRYLASGTAVCEMSIAVNKVYKQDDEKIEKVSFFDVTVFGQLAITCTDYLKKGSKICITGSIQQDRWQDKETGDTRSKIKIIGDTIQFLSTKSNDEGGKGKNAKNEHKTLGPKKTGASKRYH